MSFKGYRVGIRYPRTVLLLSLVLTSLALLVARHLRIQNDLVSLLPQEMESVKGLNQLKADFGGWGHLVVTVEATDPVVAGRFADRLARRFEQHPAVQYVDYRRPFGYFQKRQWLYLDLDDLREVEHRIDRARQLEKEGKSPVFSKATEFLTNPEDRLDLSFSDMIRKYERRYGMESREVVASDDGKFLILRVKLKENPQNFDATKNLVNDFRQIEATLRKEGAFQNVSVGFTGSYQKMIEQAELIRREIFWVSSLVSILLLLILFFYFRRWSSTLFVFLPVALAVLWTGGLIALTLSHLNIITSFAAAILAGLGSDYGIYLLSRYYQERNRGVPFGEACHKTFSGTGKATLASMLTTVAAFGALMFSKFALFYEFGVVGAVGLLFNYLAMVTVLPALLKLEEGRRQRTGIRSSFPSLEWRVPFLSRLTLRRPLVVLLFVTLCLVALLTLPSVTRIQFEDGQIENQKLPSYSLSERVGKIVGISLNPTVLMVAGFENQSRTVRTLEALLQDGNQDAVFNRVLGLSSFIPDDVAEKKVILSRTYEKAKKVQRFFGKQKQAFLDNVKSSLEAGPITRDNLPIEIKRLFESKGSQAYAIYLNPSFARDNRDSLRRYHEGILNLGKEWGLSFQAADGTFVGDDIIRIIEQEAPRGFGVLLIGLALVVFLILRPFSHTLLLFGNLLGSLLLLAGLLWLLRMPLNVISIAVVPIILGTGIDCFIHLSHRFHEEGRKDLALQLEVFPILVSNLTTFVGFGGLILTSSAGLRSAGWCAVLGISLVTVVCILVFPQSLALTELKTLKKVPLVKPEGDCLEG